MAGTLSNACSNMSTGNRLGSPVVPGRFELTIGEPEQWVPGHWDHKAVRARARHILPL